MFSSNFYHSNIIYSMAGILKIVTIIRDQPTSRFHGPDFFREIGLLQRKMPISVKFVIFREF